MSLEARRGLALFQGTAGRIACHSGPNFTDDSFHNIGVADGDPGRATVVVGATREGLRDPRFRSRP